ncbi:UNVERIFIED_CONTAM: DNA-binding death effector domain-containing protein 2, partial [Eudyptes pachyrhynchus]
WEEEECLEYYGMASLHRLFEVVGAQLTPSDVAVLSFLLDEAHPAARPRNGVELLLELERRGLCDEGNFRHLLELLRLLTRHDLLHCVTLRRPRTGKTPRAPPAARRELGGGSGGGGGPGASSQPRGGADLTGRTGPTGPPAPGHLRATGAGPYRANRGGGGNLPPPHHPTLIFLVLSPPPDIRLRVRAEYCEHESALRRGVASSRPRGPGRQLDVFSQANGVLKSRDLGSILCDIKFSELSYLDAFWGDYLNGSLLEALKGVFLTEGLRRAVGREDVRLLVSVDQDDYEEGRRLLLRAARNPPPP